MTFFKQFSLILFLATHTINSIAALEAFSKAFKTIATTQQTPASTFTNAEAYKELNYEAIINSLSRTETPFGAWALHEMLTHPLVNADALMQRQQVLNVLVYNNHAYEEYRLIIQKTNKPQLLTYWQPANQLHQNAQTLYYNFLGIFPKISNFLNSSKVALTLAGNVNSALIVLGYFGKQFFGSAFKEAMFANPPNYPQAIKDGLFYPIHLHNPFESHFNQTKLTDFYFAKESHKLSAGDWKTYLQTFITDEKLIAAAPLIAMLGTGAAVAAYDYFTAQDINNQITKIKNTYKTTAALSESVHHIAQWYNGCTQLYAFSQKYPESAQLPPFELIKKYIHGQDISPELQKLFNILAYPELKNSTPTSISTGTALLTHKLLLQIKDELIPLMKAVGECDALLSIVKLYHEQRDTDAHYCLPEFTQSSVSLEFINFWHPGVTTKNRVTNSIYLGDKNPRNIIITGPNGGGKSTTMAAISWGIILAQGWGIVPAEKASMRIFNGLRSYLSPQADLEQGLSTFMAEKRRLDTLINTIDKLKNSDAYFFIVDEPCRGTIERVSEQFVIQLCNKLAENEKCVSVLATHLEKPTFVAQENPQYLNYQMELQDNEYAFVRTFKLLPGAADWWFNNEPKRTRFLLEL